MYEEVYACFVNSGEYKIYLVASVVKEEQSL